MNGVHGWCDLLCSISGTFRYLDGRTFCSSILTQKVLGKSLKRFLEIAATTIFFDELLDLYTCQLSSGYVLFRLYSACQHGALQSHSGGACLAALQSCKQQRRRHGGASSCKVLCHCMAYVFCRRFVSCVHSDQQKRCGNCVRRTQCVKTALMSKGVTDTVSFWFITRMSSAW